MKIVLDIDQLLREGRITREEYDRLKGFASKETSSLALNILIGFGVIAVAGGVLALFQSVVSCIPLGFVLAGAGVYLGIAYPKQWKLLGGILLLIGTLTAAGGIIGLTEGHALGFLLVTVLCMTAAALVRSGLLASLATFSLLAAVGGMTGYEHASYSLGVEQPSVTIVLFGMLSAGAYLASQRLPLDFARLAIFVSRSALFIVNLGFWIGSLWGDNLGRKPDYSAAGYDGGRAIPSIVFAAGWGIGLIAVGVWAARRDKRWVVNLVSIFGAIHFYTQFFERLGPSPGTIIVAGLVAIGIAVGIIRYNKSAAAKGWPPPLPAPVAPAVQPSVSNTPDAT